MLCYISVFVCEIVSACIYLGTQARIVLCEHSDTVWLWSL